MGVRLTLGVFAVVACAGCEPLWLGQEADASPPGILRTLWTDLDRHFALFEAKGVDWDAAAAEAFPQVTAETTPDALWTVATGMLAGLRDPHVQMNDATLTRFFNAGLTEDPSQERFSRLVVENIYLRDTRQTLGDGRLIYGSPVGTRLAYLWIATFAGETSYAADLDEVITAANGMDGLILDLRANGGGTTRNLHDALAPLLERDLTYLRWRERNGPRRDDFGPFHDLTAKHDPARPAYRGRLAVLVDAFSGSSADHFHYVAKEFLPNARTFGEKTIGNFGTIERYKLLPNGWMYTYSAREARSLTGAALDATDGVLPDEVIVNTQAELRQGVDRALDAAIRYLQNPP